MKRTFLKLAASALIIGVVGAATANDITPKMLKQAEKAANQAVVALKEHQRAEAVRYAERAVLYNPSSADNRALLGQAYLQAGRFHSAETAFTDALRLDQSHGRAALGLGLVQTALGNTPEALSALARARGRVPDADLGLALALAGDSQGALEVLEPAARATGATAKVRQNLAFTYALIGNWDKARITAAQDISPDLVDQRIVQWAELAHPRGSADQLSAVLGVKSVMDAGMPTELALIEAQPAAEAPTALAAAEPVQVAPAPVPVSQPEPVAAPVAEAAPVVVATAPVAVEPQPKAEVAAVAAAEPAPLVQPVAAAPVEAVKAPQPMFVAAVVPAPVAAKPMLIKPVAIPASRPLVMASAPGRFVDAGYVVQLGAFSSQDRLESAWSGAVSRVSWLKGYSPVSTTFSLPQDSRTLYRLAVSGFGSRIEAVNLCRKVRELGRDCFVRGRAGDAPVQWVSRKTKDVYAAR